MKFSKLIQKYIEAQRAGQPEVLCPLCGHAMQNNGVAWFCYAREEHVTWLHSLREKAYQYQANGGVVFFTDLQTPPKFRYQNWDPAMQGVIIAITHSGWTFATVRGSNGHTNFRVTAPEDADLAHPPSPEDWVWAEWTGKANETPEVSDVEGDL